MTVKRTTPTTLRKAGRTYTTLPTDSIRLIKTGDALAIWCYLQTKPQDWIIRKQQIMDRLDIGRRRYAAALTHLRDIRLVAVEHAQDEHGRLVGRMLVCFDTPGPTPTKPVASVAPTIPVTDNTGLAKDAKRSPLQIIDIYTNKLLLQRGNGTEKPKKPTAGATAYHPSHHVMPALDTPTARDPDTWPAKELQAELDKKAANGQ